MQCTGEKWGEVICRKYLKKIENGKNNRKAKRKVKKEVCMKANERQMGTGRQKKEIP